MVAKEITISKNQAKNAGRILKNTNSTDSEINEAFDILSEWRARHSEPLKLAYDLVKRSSKNIDSKAFYGQRLKRAISIINKLKRFKSGLGEMQDIAGCRAIISDYAKLQRVDKQLLKSRAIQKNKGKDYIVEPKDDGYRGIHRIYKYTGKKEYCKNLPVEIQLRTQLQHSWATAVEIIDIFEKENLKSGLGSDDWKRFFYLVSNEFAKLEELPVIDSTTTTQELISLCDSLSAIEKLKGYSVVSTVATSNKKIKSFLLIRLNRKERRVSISDYSDDLLAKEMYKAMEKEYKNNDDYDVLLVQSGSLMELRKSYPNYFADSKLFVEMLEKVIGRK